VVIADRIKKVQDSHLLELIQDVTNDNGAGQKFPPAATPRHFRGLRRPGLVPTPRTCIPRRCRASPDRRR